MAIKAGVGLSTEKDPSQAAREAIRQARYALNADKISMALVFGSIGHSTPEMLSVIKNVVGARPVLGCSSIAIMTRQGVFKNALAVVLLNIPESIPIGVGHVKNITNANEAGKALGDQLSYGFRNIRRGFGLVFSDGYIEDGSAFLNGIQERVGLSLPIAGGSASDDLELHKTFQYFDSDVFSSSACGIMWGGKATFELGTKHGWQPLGKPHRVTGARGNIVYQIDGESAADFYADYFNCDLATLRKNLKKISIFYPIGIYLPLEHEYLLRNIIRIDDKGGILFQGNVPEGSDIRLMIGTKESCLNATQEAVNEIKKTLAGNPVDFMLIFDSISRYTLLGRDAHKEIDIIRKNLGDTVPLLGIYTYNEQAPLKALDYRGRAYLHNQTISVVGIGG